MNKEPLFGDKLREYTAEIAKLTTLSDDRKAYLEVNKRFFKNTPAGKCLIEHYRNQNMDKVKDIVDKIGDLFALEIQLNSEEISIIKIIKTNIKNGAAHHLLFDIHIHYFTFLVANGYLEEGKDFQYFEGESFKDYEKYSLSLEEIREKFGTTNGNTKISIEGKDIFTMGNEEEHIDDIGKSTTLIQEETIENEEENSELGINKLREKLSKQNLTLVDIHETGKAVRVYDENIKYYAWFLLDEKQNLKAYRFDGLHIDGNSSYKKITEGEVGVVSNIIEFGKQITIEYSPSSHISPLLDETGENVKIYNIDGEKYYTEDGKSIQKLELSPGHRGYVLDETGENILHIKYNGKSVKVHEISDNKKYVFIEEGGGWLIYKNGEAYDFILNGKKLFVYSIIENNYAEIYYPGKRTYDTRVKLDKTGEKFETIKVGNKVLILLDRASPRGTIKVCDENGIGAEDFFLDENKELLNYEINGEYYLVIAINKENGKFPTVTLRSLNDGSLDNGRKIKKIVDENLKILDNSNDFLLQIKRFHTDNIVSLNDKDGYFLLKEGKFLDIKLDGNNIEYPIDFSEENNFFSMDGEGNVSFYKIKGDENIYAVTNGKDLIYLKLLNGDDIRIEGNTIPMEEQEKAQEKLFGI